MTSKRATPKALARRLAWLLFATAFIAFAYFHQGGGWNQNARFAMVRAIVEEAGFSIDSYLIYARAKLDPSTELRRIRLRNAEYAEDGRTNVLIWKNAQGQPFPVNSTLEGRIQAVDALAKVIDIRISEKASAAVSVTDATEITQFQTKLPFSALETGNVVKVQCALDEVGRAVAKKITLIEGKEARDIALVNLRAVAASGDVAYYGDHFHPNKAPGTSFIALPAYWLIYHLEKILGANPDEWWTPTLNAWLTSVFSAGLLSALGIVVVYRFALAFSGDRARESLMTALTFAFGTMFFPYATSFYEHNIIAVGLIASFYFLYRAKTASTSGHEVDSSPNTKAAVCIFLSGLCAGYAAITNYIIAVVVIFLGLYVFLAVRSKNGWLWFGLGLLGPFLLICVYNIACFGTPFTTNYRHQNPFFISGTNTFLGVFILPRWDVLLAILFSPFRGLFFSSPVLLIGLWGLVWLFRNKNFRAEAWLLIVALGFFVLFNISFNGWDGGDTAVPRYLGPAVPFLALPIVFGFIRFFKTSCALAIISIAIMLLTTAVDPEAPIGTRDIARILDRPLWQYNPLTEYELPIFLTKRAGPFMRKQEEQVLHYYEKELANRDMTPELRRTEVEKLRQFIEDSIAAGVPAPLVLTRIGQAASAQYSIDMSELPLLTGPISANFDGIYGGWSAHGEFGSPGSEQLRWNSFNFGEFLFPQSRWSLLPLLLGCGPVRMARF